MWTFIRYFAHNFFGQKVTFFYGYFFHFHLNTEMYHICGTYFYTCILRKLQSKKIFLDNFLKWKQKEFREK